MYLMQTLHTVTRNTKMEPPKKSGQSFSKELRRYPYKLHYGQESQIWSKQQKSITICGQIP